LVFFFCKNLKFCLTDAGERGDSFSLPLSSLLSPSLLSLSLSPRSLPLSSLSPSLLLHHDLLLLFLLLLLTSSLLHATSKS